MRTLQLTNPIEPQIIKEKMASAKTVSDYKRWLVLHQVSTFNVDAAYIAELTGYSIASVYSIVQQHNNPNKSDVDIKSRGGRRRSILSVEEEQTMMQKLEQQALDGQILSYLDIKKIVELKVKRVVSDDFIWDLFKRNGWTKHSPRPHHPKKNEAAQETFKKNSKSVWLPLKLVSTMI
jgi:transposase